ncbi:MAG TPA: hypothetical protein PK971_10370 [Saprospiraceae bacterium]|nr:hypothetical protein [Saprospiraceae bacterium]HND88722.1 hypothetical protein [Saprospiraceae bacterium]
MTNKQLIGAAVAGLILFVWQFLSWSLLPIHQSEMAYHPNQDKIMEALNQQIAEPGTYFLPNVPPGASQEEHHAYMERNAGKPWAMVSYHRSMETSMGMNMLRGFAADLLAAFLLIWLLGKMGNPSGQTALLSAVAVGVIGYLAFPYLNSIWFKSNSLGHLVDAIVPWALVGLWLGWWMNRR